MNSQQRNRLLRDVRSALLTLVSVVIIGGLLHSSSQTALATGPWNIGDVFVGDVSGNYFVYDNSGVFKEQFNAGTGGLQTGCGFDTGGNLYTTNYTANTMREFDSVDYHLRQALDMTMHGGGSPESIVFDVNGNFYIGNLAGNADIQKYNSAGVFQRTYDVQIDPGGAGSDWLDLSSDQHTMFYTSETRKIFRYDLASDTQLSPFATLPGLGIAYAIRLLPPGDGSGGLLVADNANNIKRLDASGTVIQTYDLSGSNNWYGLSLDPNGTSFWTTDTNISNRALHRFNIATGSAEVNVNVGASRIEGVCVKGEITTASVKCATSSNWCTQNTRT